jgi:hypothetical protein
MLKRMRKRMLRLKMTGLWMSGRTSGARKRLAAGAGVLAASLLVAGATEVRAQATSSSADTTTTRTQTTTTITTSGIKPSAPVTYDNKYEIYGGINFMNFEAGQNLPTRMNMAGAEFLATFWLPKDHWYSNIGPGLDYRGEAGTTPVLAAAGQYPYQLARPLVYMNMLMVGAQYRGPKNHYVAINYHGFGGASKGVFNATQTAGQPAFYEVTGLYTNRTKPIYALGGSIDFNRSKNLAIRLSPDLILEHFGSETREFFAISGGVIYRFGKN